MRMSPQMKMIIAANARSIKGVRRLMRRLLKFSLMANVVLMFLVFLFSGFFSYNDLLRKFSIMTSGMTVDDMKKCGLRCCRYEGRADLSLIYSQDQESVETNVTYMCRNSFPPMFFLLYVDKDGYVEHLLSYED